MPAHTPTVAGRRGGRIGFARGLVCLLFSAALGLPGVAAAEDGVRVSVSGPQVPFETAEYAVEVKRGTVVAEYSKRFAARFGHLDRVAALTRPDLTALLDRLDALGLWTLRDARRANAGLRWTIKAQRGDRRIAITIDEPTLQPGPHLAVIAAVRARVEAELGRSIFQDPMLLRSEGGVLNLRTRPPARVRLDGVLLAAPTPIRGLRVEAGRRKVELLPIGGGPPVTHTVRVEAGRATSLNLTLE